MRAECRIRTIMPLAPSRPPLYRRPLDQSAASHKLRDNNSAPASIPQARRLLMHAHSKLKTDSDRGHLRLLHVIGHVIVWEATSKWIRTTCHQRRVSQDHGLSSYRDWVLSETAPDKPIPHVLNCSTTASATRPSINVLNSSNEFIPSLEQKKLATVTTMELL